MDNTALPAERQNENAGHYAVFRSWFAASRRELVDFKTTASKAWTRRS